MSIEADTLAAQALQAYEKSDYEQAINLFERARSGYVSAGMSLKAAEVSNNLSVALGQVNRFQGALDALEGTYDLFLQHGDRIKAAQSLGNAAAAHEGLGDWEKAESLYEQAAEDFNELGDSESRRFTLQALSRVRLRQGRAIEAVSTMQGALESGGKRNWRVRLVQNILSLPSRLLKP